jgi:hypothetical protein
MEHSHRGRRDRLTQLKAASCRAYAQIRETRQASASICTQTAHLSEAGPPVGSAHHVYVSVFLGLRADKVVKEKAN